MENLRDLANALPNPFDTLRNSGYSFPALPAEIKTEIYKHVLAWPFNAHLTHYPDQFGLRHRLRLSHGPLESGADERSREARRVSAFILSNKVIYNDAIEMLYSAMAIKSRISVFGAHRLPQSFPRLVTNIRQLSQAMPPSPSSQVDIEDIMRTLPRLEVFSFGIGGSLRQIDDQTAQIKELLLETMVSLVTAKGSALTKAFVLKRDEDYQLGGLPPESVVMIADTVDDQRLRGIAPGPRMWIDLETGIATLPPEEA